MIWIFCEFPSDARGIGFASVRVLLIKLSDLKVGRPCVR